MGIVINGQSEACGEDAVLVDSVQDSEQSSAGGLTLEQKQVVDRYVSVAKDLEPFSALLKEQDKIKKLMQSIAESVGAGEDLPVELRGDVGVVMYGPKSKTRTIKDPDGLLSVLLSKIGHKAVLAMIKFTLGDLDKLLTPEELAPFIEEGRGSRSLKGYVTL